MKRAISIFFVCIMCAALMMPCFATEFANPPIVDDAGYLMQYELSELSEKLERVRQKYDFDVAIVTESDLSSYSAMASADDIYDYQGYGAGVNDSGIMLYICSGTREYWITTHADGERIFNDNGIAYLESIIETYLLNDDYYGAMYEFIDIADELLQMAENGTPYDEEDSSTVMIIIICALVIPLIIAWIMMRSKLAMMKTATENNYAENYIKQGSKHINVSRDIFLYSRVRRTERPKNNSGGSHVSSSGRTHGGGGGRF